MTMTLFINDYLLRKIAPLCILNIIIILSVPFLSDIAALWYLFYLPGSFLTPLLEMRMKDPWTRILNTVAMSSAFILFGGLLANTIGPLLGISNPLEKNFLLLFFNVLLSALLIFRVIFIRDKNYERQPLVSLEKIKPHAFLVLLPIFAIIAATIINNNGNNTLSMFFIATVAIFIIFLSTTKSNISENFLMSSIYFISLALLLMTSMRGWHITGYDVHKELEVFGFTQSALFWSMEHLQDAYNACLSITILPTIVSQFISMPNEYIYKFLFQIIFALMPVALYRLVRNFGDAKTAFLATIFSIVQVWFFQGMPTLIRQEFGILFFTLVIMILFDPLFPKRTRYALACLYGGGMVVSHYSTTYIAILLFLGVFIMNKSIALYNRFKSDQKLPYHISHCVTFSYIIFLLVSVLTWNTLVTGTSNNFSEFIDKSSSNIAKVFTSDVLTMSLNQLLYAYPQKIDFPAYVERVSAQFHEDHPELDFYPKETYQNIALQPIEFKQVPSNLGEPIHEISMLTFKLLKIIVNNIFILFGMFSILYMWREHDFLRSEFALLSVAGFILLGFLLLIPGALQEYNLERLYFQLLILWSFVGVFGGMRILEYFLKRERAYSVLTGIYVLLLLFYSGFIFDFTGGPALIAINNYGEDFEKFYTYSTDVNAAEWLGKRYQGKLIHTNSHGANKLAAFGRIPKESVIHQTLPSVISKESFVFLTYINTVGGKATFSYNGDEYAYTYPLEFLEAQKDEIYSNGISRIYR